MPANSRLISASVSIVSEYAPLRLEEPRVLDGDRHRRGEVAERLDLGRRELAEVAAQQVERANRAALAPERHHQLRLRAGHAVDVVRLVGHVVGQQRPAGRDRAADEPLAGLQPRGGRPVRIPFGVRDPDVAVPLVDQVDGHRVEVGHAGDQAGQFPVQLVEVEDRGHLAAQSEQRRQQLPVALGDAGALALAGRHHVEVDRLGHTGIILGRSMLPGLGTRDSGLAFCRAPSPEPRAPTSVSCQWTNFPSTRH